MIILALSGATSQEGFEKSDWYLYLSFLINPIAFAGIAFVILRWKGTSVRKAIKEEKCEAKYFLIAILMQFGLLALSELNVLFLDFLSQFGYQPVEIILPSLDGFGFIGVLFTVAVLPAIFEEIIFRGLLLKGLRSFGTVGMILLSGALFALYHQNPAQTLYQFCCGVAFALVAVKAGSVLPTILSHFLNNALIVTLTKFGVNKFPPPVYVTMLNLEIIAFIVAMVWLVLDKKDKNAQENTEENEATQEESKKERRRFWAFSAVGIFICVLSWLSVLITGM